MNTLPAPGALLDAAGQLVGYWLLATHERDPLTMPTGVARLRRFGPLPAPGTPVDCRVRIAEVKAALEGAGFPVRGLTAAGSEV